MSALTDLFTSYANKIRSKVGGSQTYTPLEMVDAIDDVYDAGAASVPTPTDITPSNASPVALAANTPVNPTASGYAISSYSSKTPSDTNPPSISSGAIIKASASGYFTKNKHPVFGGTPNKTYQNNTAGTSGTVDITVSQKPRYIVVAIWGRNSNYRGFLGVVDVEQQKGYRMGYVTSGAVDESWSGYANYFTTISATKVTYNTAGFGENHRVQIQIFY